jgi:hypothetical protein
VEDVLRTLVLIVIPVLLLNTSYLNTAYGQEGPPGEAGVTDEPLSPFTPTANQTGPETAEELANLIGNNTAIILNDTAISNLHNTLLDSIGINIREDCIRLPDSSMLYCP